MQFKDWGEEKFIEHLREHFPSKGLLTGIGDDCAVIPSECGKVWLITTDALVEGVHFLKDQIPARELGYKLVAVNISDIVAMGGIAKYAFLSIALPKEIDCAWVHSLIQGVKEACEKWNLLLLGGDTVGSKRDLFLNLSLIGSAVESQIKYRHQAMPRDIICVTGYLGDAGGGLRAIQDKLWRTEEIEYLMHVHFHPEPEPQHGIWLASSPEVHAMMDISDGLDCDLKRLIKSSQGGAIIETSKIPISPTLGQVCLEHGWNSLQLALTGGEDYCLLFTVSEKGFDGLQHDFQQAFGAPLYPIGCIVGSSAKLVYLKNGEVIQIDYPNFDHFR